MPAAAISDDVVAAARLGDPDALSAIYVTYAPVVVGYLHAKGVTDPEATASDVFVSLLRSIGTVTGGASGLRTLLFSIAHARVVDEHRARARRPHMVAYHPAEDSRSTASAEEEAHTGLGAEEVCEILGVLPDDQRDVLALRIVADLSVEQVAKIIGRSQGAVKQLQRRGLLRVRAALTQRQVSL